MRISVECGGFTRAADACAAANQTSAVLTLALADRLVPTAGMAGNDATSTDFAQAYDAGAREAVAALADLTHAFIGAGRLLATTGRNHASAEAGAGASVVGYVGDDLDDSAYVRVRPPVVPSSLGSQEPSLGVVDAWILDQLEGFVWPGADVSLLRSAAGAWRRAAASTAGLADHVDVALTFVEAQHSPEVPLAVDALTDLGRLIGDTAWQLAGLADACEEYADAVEAARDRTRALLSEVAQMVVEGAAISVLVTGLTGGLGGAASVAAAAAKVRSHAPRFYALLTALRASAAASVSRLERVRDELAVVRSRVQRFVRAPVRNEVGAVKPGAWLPPRKTGWLRDHEVPPGHTIELHVGKTSDELLQRFERWPRLKRSSTFADESEAEHLISRVIQRREDEIRQWLARPSGKLTLEEDLGIATGRSIGRDGTVHIPTGVRVVLISDARAPTGWRILTAFPD
ncbi:hypothetical protein L2K70_02470 [Nocardioides KLBMP 9356]|uniref:Bacterial CdiA-CT RNAse A domain-containing protein n=1 Tax=Nocardioides potassii TaxID=2911371 RepID=A0ABS9H5C6_9ACTN|nr:RNase A-like domain-containing protein [Nocardioides potassii]MCF6376457.1 hypothetical protein [Nocardioides potassii]